MLTYWECPECEGINLNEDGTICWDCLACDYDDLGEEAIPVQEEKDITNELTYCVTCEGITLYWDIHSQEWIATYVDGGIYCVCPNDTLSLQGEFDNRFEKVQTSFVMKPSEMFP